ncbi:MAG: S8 family peptidase [Pseudonocardiaceae bacterium]
MTEADSVQPIRIAVRAAARTSAAAVQTVTERAMTDLAGVRGPVRVAGLGPDSDDRDWLLEVSATDAIGSPSYASAAWELTHRLQDTGVFALVEADVPVGAFAPRATGIGSFGGGDCRADALSTNHDWALDVIGWAAAMDLMDPATRGGTGIRVGHPDSGFSDHFALGPVVDRAADWDVIDDDDDATDPLRPPRRRFFNPLPNPGHGTSTASVIVGAGDQDGFRGIAPNAVLIPFRATESVVQLFDSDVADAVRRARKAGCHIVSMSLGGTGFFGLREAIQEAVDDGMIVMAAAGNQVGIVTAPASYDNCLAVAATGTGDTPWSGSSRGSAVDVSAPGSCVWAALFDWSSDPPGRIVDRSHGTSYAVAHLAGIAALWLAHHGHQALCDRYGRNQVQAAFLHLLRTPGVCVRPPGWDDDWGVGRIDANALLSQPLPDPSAVGGVAAFAAGGADDPVSRLAALTSTDPERVRGWLAETLGPDDIDARARRFEGEFAYLLLEDPSFLAGLAMPGFGAFSADPPVAASLELQAFLADRRSPPGGPN